MFNIVLYEPEIPPNTGNIIRLCANSGCQLHLVHPLGFTLEDRQLRRAGLDYREFARVREYPDLDSCLRELDTTQTYAISTRGKKNYDKVSYTPGANFIFGPETRGLPEKLLKRFDNDHILRIPMQTGSRSLNLSNAVAVLVYEALRQNDFNF